MGACACRRRSRRADGGHLRGAGARAPPQALDLLVLRYPGATALLLVVQRNFLHAYALHAAADFLHQGAVLGTMRCYRLELHPRSSLTDHVGFLLWTFEPCMNSRLTT